MNWIMVVMVVAVPFGALLSVWAVSEARSFWRMVKCERDLDNERMTQEFKLKADNDRLVKAAHAMVVHECGHGCEATCPGIEGLINALRITKETH